MDTTLLLEHACNLRCSYCYTGGKFSRPMTRELIDAAARLALSDQPREIRLSFIGGEPLLELELIKYAIASYQKHIDEAGRPVMLTLALNTNGTLLTESLCEFLRVSKVKLHVSLDGPAELHDRHRKTVRAQGSYEQVLKGLALAEAAQLPYQLHGVVSPDTAERMGEQAQELLRHPAQSVSLVPNLSAAWSDAELQSFQQGCRDAAAAWEVELRRGRVALFDPFHSKILSHLMGAGACESRCSLALKSVAVAPSGYLYSCAQQVGEDQLEELRIGHVLSGPDAGRAAVLRRQAQSVESVCSSCELRSRCVSACACSQRASSGSIGRIDGVLCSTEASYIAAADELASRLYSEEVEAFQRIYYQTAWKLKRGAQARALPLLLNRDSG